MTEIPGWLSTEIRNCDATDTPRLMYLRLLFLQIQIISGCSPFASVFDLKHRMLTVAFMTDFGLHPGLHEPLKPASEPPSETKEKQPD